MSESEWKGEKRREKKKGIEGGRGGWGEKERGEREREREIVSGCSRLYDGLISKSW